MKKRFTLIELVVVVLMIAIISAIVILNTTEVKRSAIVNSIKLNVRNIQMASDQHTMRNGEIPNATGELPRLGRPTPIDLDKLKEGGIRSLPLQGNYWIDHEGTVWGSVTVLPKELVVEEGYVRWIQHETSGSYTLWMKSNEELSGKASRLKWTRLDKVVNDGKLIGQIRLSEETLSQAEEIYLQATDKYGLETPPVQYIKSERTGETSHFVQFDKVVSSKNMKEDRLMPIESSDGWSSVSFVFETQEEKYLHGVERQIEGITPQMPSPEEVERFGRQDVFQNHLRPMTPNLTIEDIILDRGGVLLTYQSSVDGVSFSKETTFPQSVPPGSVFKVNAYVLQIPSNLGTEVVPPSLRFGDTPLKQEGGVMDTSSEETTTPDTPVMDGHYKKIFQGSGDGMYALTHDGRLKAWGYASGSSLGTGKDKSFVPEDVPIEEKVVDVKSTTHNSFAFTSEGTIYVWGASSTQVVPKTTGMIHTPVVFPHFRAEDVIDIKGTGRYVVILTRSGEVYGLGRSSEYQFGTGVRKGYTTPVKIDLPDKVIKFEVSDEDQVVYLLENGQLWGTGQNFFVSLNVKKGMSNIYPYQFNSTEKVKDFWFNGNSVIFKDVKNDFWGFGYNSYSQLRSKKSSGETHIVLEKLTLLTERNPHEIWAEPYMFYYTYGPENTIVQQHDGSYSVKSNVQGIKGGWFDYMGLAVYESTDGQFYMMMHRQPEYCGVNNNSKKTIGEHRMDVPNASETVQVMFNRLFATFHLKDGRVQTCGFEPYGNPSGPTPMRKVMDIQE